MKTATEITKLNTSNFNEVIENSTGPVLVDFWAEWCGPCKQMNPVLEQLAEEVQASATIAKVNVDESPDLARRFGIQSIPTFAIFKNGELAEQFSGVTTKQKLKDHLH